MQVGNSLLLSKEFQAIGYGAGQLYLCMAMESGGKREFTFSRSIAKKYGIQHSSYDNYVKKLISAGFIEPLDDGEYAQYSKTAYRFSLAWKGI